MSADHETQTVGRYLNPGKTLAWMLATLLLTACKTTDDPREGGFFGGVQGLSTGAYEKRIQEREARLQRLKQLQGDLEAERVELEKQQQNSRSAYAQERQRLSELSQETRSLEQKLLSLRTTEQEQESLRLDLLEQLSQLKQNIDQTANSSDSRADTLSSERDALEEEYRLLLDVYLEISQ